MLLSCGDALVDFLPVTSVDGRDAAVPVAGGSCLNIAVGMARLGAPAGFVGGISTDLFGRIDCRPRVGFAGRPSLCDAQRASDDARVRPPRRAASRNMRSMTRQRRPETGPIERGSIPFDEIEAIHVGSTTLANDKGAAQALAMIEDAGGSTTISFDPNCRPNLVRHKARYVDQMNAFAAAADIVRMSDVDFEFLYGGERLRRKGEVAYRGWCKSGRRYARDQWSPGVAQGAGPVKVEAPTISVVDTIGAGDSFQAALLFALRAIGRIKRGALAQMNADELGRALSFAAACAAFTCGRAGADPPRQSDVGPALSRLLT